MPSKKKKYNARFPPARIKKIMQTDEDVGKVAAAVPVIISRALELFIDSLIEKTATVTKAKNAKTLSTSHVKQAIHSEKMFDFLRDLVVNVPDHQTEDDGDNPTPSGSGTQERKPKVPRPRKPREDGARGPGRPKKIKVEEKKEPSSEDEVTETDDDVGSQSDHQGGVSSSFPPPSSTVSMPPQLSLANTTQLQLSTHPQLQGPIHSPALGQHLPSGSQLLAFGSQPPGQNPGSSSQKQTMGQHPTSNTQGQPISPNPGSSTQGQPMGQTPTSGSQGQSSDHHQQISGHMQTQSTTPNHHSSASAQPPAQFFQIPPFQSADGSNQLLIAAANPQMTGSGQGPLQMQILSPIPPQLPVSSQMPPQMQISPVQVSSNAAQMHTSSGNLPPTQVSSQGQHKQIVPQPIPQILVSPQVPSTLPMPLHSPSQVHTQIRMASPGPHEKQISPTAPQRGQMPPQTPSQMSLPLKPQPQKAVPPPQSLAPQSHTPQSLILQSHTSQSLEPQSHTPQSHTPQSLIPHSHTSQSLTPQSHTPQSHTPPQMQKSPQTPPHLQTSPKAQSPQHLSEHGQQQSRFPHPLPSPDSSTPQQMQSTQRSGKLKHHLEHMRDGPVLEKEIQQRPSIIRSVHQDVSPDRAPSSNMPLTGKQSSRDPPPRKQPIAKPLGSSLPVPGPSASASSSAASPNHQQQQHYEAMLAQHQMTLLAQSQQNSFQQPGYPMHNMPFSPYSFPGGIPPMMPVGFPQPPGSAAPTPESLSQLSPHYIMPGQAPFMMPGAQFGDPRQSMGQHPYKQQGVPSGQNMDKSKHGHESSQKREAPDMPLDMSLSKKSRRTPPLKQMTDGPGQVRSAYPPLVSKHPSMTAGNPYMYRGPNSRQVSEALQATNNIGVMSRSSSCHPPTSSSSFLPLTSDSSSLRPNSTLSQEFRIQYQAQLDQINARVTSTLHPKRCRCPPCVNDRKMRKLKKKFQQNLESPQP